ncbi:MAG: imidazole glycerol phosphate synthase subunit HisF [Rhodospirillales bacterium]|nr:MAG: imidazole glycerol phosphate synthase subunit HisF [Rhodospirillales bacterium]
MLRARVLPCLLLRRGQLVKGVKFADHRYIGDPINAVRIFNDRPIDELALFDIEATRSGAGPDFDRLTDIVSECFVPICYGGGVSTVEQARRLLRIGVEKVCLNSAALDDPSTVGRIADAIGSQSVVVSIDVRRDFLRRGRVWSHAGRKPRTIDPATFAREMQAAGAGELVVGAVDRDGTMSGVDLELTAAVAGAVDIPVIAMGGAGGPADLRAAIREGGASAVAAGAMFVFQGRHRAVLINFPTQDELDAIVAP